jgi:hypothetical protein
VLATRSDDLLTCPDGRRHEAKTVAAIVGKRAWERRSAGAGAHGERLHDWTVLALDSTGLLTGWSRWLLIRRQITPPPGKAPELAFYRCAGPASTPVPSRPSRTQDRVEVEVGAVKSANTSTSTRS